MIEVREARVAQLKAYWAFLFFFSPVDSSGIGNVAAETITLYLCDLQWLTDLPAEFEHTRYNLCESAAHSMSMKQN